VNSGFLNLNGESMHKGSNPYMVVPAHIDLTTDRMDKRTPGLGAFRVEEYCGGKKEKKRCFYPVDFQHCGTSCV
jgi:hypothetical protein